VCYPGTIGNTLLPRRFRGKVFAQGASNQRRAWLSSYILQILKREHTVEGHPITARMRLFEYRIQRGSPQSVPSLAKKITACLSMASKLQISTAIPAMRAPTITLQQLINCASQIIPEGMSGFTLNALLFSSAARHQPCAVYGRMPH
jgi:hypothetical protein